MRTRHADRIWIISGAATAVLLLALGWFLAVGPALTQAATLRDEAGAAEVRLNSLHGRLGELKVQQAQLPRFQAELKSYQAALPSDSGVPNFLRDLQRSGDAANVIVSGVTVGIPEPPKGGSQIYALPITVTAEGSAANLGRFVDRLQSVQPRAVLITSAAMAASGTSAGAGKMTINLAMKAFVAPAPEKPVPAVAATG